MLKFIIPNYGLALETQVLNYYCNHRYRDTYIIKWKDRVNRATQLGANMLAISWIYIIHDIILAYISLKISQQLFSLKFTLLNAIYFVFFMQVVFIFNDFIIEPNFELQFKYIIILIGFYTAYLMFVKMHFVSALLIMLCNLAVNGVSTNLNIQVLLLARFNSYGAALENDFLQYSSLILVMIFFYLILRLFKFQIVDISRYN